MSAWAEIISLKKPIEEFQVDQGGKSYRQQVLKMTELKFLRTSFVDKCTRKQQHVKLSTVQSAM